MMTFDSHLKEKLKNKRFKRMYEEEKELLDISLKILEVVEEFLCLDLLFQLPDPLLDQAFDLFE